MGENYEWRMSVRTFFLSHGRRFFFRRAIETCVISLVRSDCDAHEESIRFGQNERCCSRSITRTFSIATCACPQTYLFINFSHWFWVNFNSNSDSSGYDHISDEIRCELNLHWVPISCILWTLAFSWMSTFYSFCMWLHRVQSDIRRPPQRTDGMWKNYLDHKINEQLRSRWTVWKCLRHKCRTLHVLSIGYVMISVPNDRIHAIAIDTFNLFLPWHIAARRIRHCERSALALFYIRVWCDKKNWLERKLNKKQTTFPKETKAN